MKGLINGKIVELTEEQKSLYGLDRQVDPAPTDIQRIAALEEAVADLAIMLVGGFNVV